MSTLMDIAEGVGNLNNNIQNLTSNIAGGMQQSFLGAENTNRSLTDAAQRLYDTLDKTANRTYINSGFANINRTKPNNRNIIAQTPEMIILIKKRMFSSLADNYRFEFMDEEEKHFIRASKKLFENKCEEISNYEKLTKLNKIIQENQTINSPLAQVIYQTLNSIEGNEFNKGTDFLTGANKYTKDIAQHKEVIKQIRQLLTLNGFNQTTTWIKDSTFEQTNSQGKGTGVIELTLVKNATFTNSIEFEGGRGSFSVSDPCRLFFIEEADVEKAIFQTAKTSFNVVNTLNDMLQQDNDEFKQELNHLRLSRGASSLTYKTDISTKIYNRVSVILDRIGVEITKSDGSGIDYDKLNNPNIPSFEIFKPEEKTLLDRIYKNIFKILQNKINDYQDFRKYNYNTNNIRKNMRTNYMGKQLIQPMDIVTAFIDSQSIDDSILAFEIKQSFLNSSADTITSKMGLPNIAANTAATLGSTNLAGLLSKTIGQIGQIGYQTQMQAEKAILAGPDFPDWLYSALRPNFTSQSFGTCVFSGIVQGVSESYNDGAYALTVNCANNSNYFDQGWLQTKPGLNQFNGYIYDPITPFNFEFDEANGLLPDISKFELLPENSKYISSGMFKYADGRFAGQTITEENFKNADVEPQEGLSKLIGTYTNIGKKIFQAPDGFVYKWKKGIGTAIVNQSGIKDGLMNNKLIHSNIAQVKEEDAFGGQDIVNILSILICGEPYNFNTFLKASIGNEVVGSERTFDPSSDYFQGLMNQVKKQNKIWGNFIPFKKLDVDPATFGKSMALQLMSFSKNSTIKKLQNERAQLLDKLMQIEGTSSSFDVSIYSAPTQGVPITPIKTVNRFASFNLIKKIIELDAEITINEQSMIEGLSDTNINKSVVSIGSNLFSDQNITLSGADAKASYKLTLAKQNELTKRRLWKVKGNIDKNLFIVGSEYDNDFDIQAIAKTIGNETSYINTSWQKPIEKLKIASSVIGMELFVNSQGHIEFRAPRYNRIPSSILFEMFKKKAECNIQIFPNFLEKTFDNKIKAAFDEVEILEDQIRLRAIALGATYNGNDTEIQMLLGGTLTSINNDFIFVTDQNGSLTNVRKAVTQINNDYTEAYNKPQSMLAKISPITFNDTSTGDFFKRKADLVKNFVTATNTFNNFDIIQQSLDFRYAYIKYSADSNYFQNRAITAQPIRERLSKKLGIPVDSASILTIPQLLPLSKNGKLSAVDVTSLTRDLDGLVTQRYEALITCVNLIKSLDQAARINSVDDNTIQKLLMPNLYGEENVPEFLKNMIENELDDDYGFNSGKRFILKENDIISMNYREDSPEFTSVVVSGSELGGIASGPGGFLLSNAGMSNVWAVDYDLWRMYGAKEATGKHLPFLSNAETQLAPYALFLLNQQRANIFRGDVTIRGNEYVQPGEVYYIQERGMLFYSKDVTHSFTYGESFTTTITLTYGHVPGEYIPTPLDVIGKNVYNGHHLNTGNYRVARSGTTATDNKTHLNTFIFTNVSTAEDFVGNNAQVRDDILAKVNLLLEPTLPQINKNMEAVTVRIYSIADPTTEKAENGELYGAALSVVQYLIDKGVPKSLIVGKTFDSDDLIPGAVMIVNLNAKTGTRNPSNIAYSYAKDDDLIKVSDFSASEVSSMNSNTILTKKLCSSIIDVWIEEDIVPNEAFIKSASQSTTSSNNKTTVSPTTIQNMQQYFKGLDYDNIIK